MFLKNFLWWLGFTVAAVIAQSVFTGVDFLVVGLVISLQEERFAQSVWLFILFTLIQEGAGSLAFGSSILWYGAVMVLFMVGRWLLEPRSLLFILLLGAGLGVWHYGLVSWMVFLQDFQVSTKTLFWESLVQAMVFGPAWGLAYHLRFGGDDDVLAA